MTNGNGKTGLPPRAGHAAPLAPLLSSVQGIGFPAIPGQAAATMLGLLYQLDETQWWDADTLLQHQLGQLHVVLGHALATVPYYRERLGKAGLDLRQPLTAESWRNLPILTRRDIQDAGDQLLSRRIPPSHGKTYTTQTSGSTGQPVKITGTMVNRLFWRVLTLRDHHWHRHDLSGKLCAIRAGHGAPGDGTSGERTQNGWGSATDLVYRTGPAALLPVNTDISQQAEWLLRHDPDYLLTYPSNLRALTEHFQQRGLRLPKLREIRTIGEMLPASLRELCRESWGVPLVDTYSSQEVGYITLQCPESELHHLQAESLYVEILDDAGRPCGPGEIGRVVVTPLHNFATPLLRYELRDYAEVGPPCPCGRGLPTLSRIVGRVRNMLLMPNGERRWPLVGFSAYREIAPIRQYQLVQKTVEKIEVRLVVDRALTAEEENRLAAVIRDALGHAFELAFVYLPNLPLSAGGKFEEFLSEVPGT